jgi:hypothetical protein
MRTGLLVTFGLTWLIAGGTCLPLINYQHQAIPGEVLGISVDSSALDTTIPEGTPVDIMWSAANLTGEPASVAITLESRRDLTKTALAEGITLDGTSSGARDVLWNTEGFRGPYSIIAHIETSTLVRDDTSRGLVTVDGRPMFEFTAPAGDVTFKPAAGPLTIAWRAEDESATVRIGVDPDTDHASGNETFIHEQDLPTSLQSQSFDWDGTDTSGAAVPVGIYNLFASATDNVNDVVSVDALGLITIAE